MASIERTAYPRFRRLVTAQDLAFMSPAEDEVAWARARARSDEHLLALVLALSCFQRLGYFCTSRGVLRSRRSLWSTFVVVCGCRRERRRYPRLTRGSGSAGWCGSGWA